MKIIKKIVDFYLDASIHVALSCFSLVHITLISFNILEYKAISFFAFFGTILGYNFVKYDALVRPKITQMKLKLKAIFILSLVSFIATGFYFFQLHRLTQIVSILVFILTLLYTLPFFPSYKNARNWAGMKIYIVALCWVGVTVLLPVIDAEILLTLDFYLVSIQRFILVFVLILIFEIIDLKHDDPHLQTVPQQIGVKQTKKLGYVLMLLFGVLAFFTTDFNFQLLPFIFEVSIATISILFLAFANENRSRYYTSFWVESIPILWWLMLLYFRKI